MTLRPLLMMVVLASFTVASGCSPINWWREVRAPEVYVESGNIVELRGDQRVKVWYRDKDGNVKRGFVNAYDRYLLGPAMPTIVDGGKK